MKSCELLLTFSGETMVITIVHVDVFGHHASRCCLSVGYPAYVCIVFSSTDGRVVVFASIKTLCAKFVNAVCHVQVYSSCILKQVDVHLVSCLTRFWCHQWHCTCNTHVVCSVFSMQSVMFRCTQLVFCEHICANVVSCLTIV